MSGPTVIALQTFLRLRGSSARAVPPHPRILIPIIALDVLIHPLSAQPNLGAVQPSSVLPTQTMSRPTISFPSLHIPVNICLHRPEVLLPSQPTSLPLSVSHLPAKYFDLAHASQSPANARRHSVSLSRRSPLRLTYLAFPLHRPQMTLSCFMVACDIHSRQSQQTRAKPRCSRAHPPVRENSCLRSIPAHSISLFQAYPMM